jgi:hypothetical protein
MYDLIFSTPWWLPTLICGVGIAVFITANNRQETRLRTAGIVIFSLGILLCIVSYLVETDKEKVERHTHEFISAIIASDWPKVQSLLDPQVEFLKLRGPDQLVAAIRAAQEHIKVTSAHITSTHIDESPSDITENIGVLSIQEATLAQGTVTGWRLDWAPTPDGKDWKLLQIKSLGGPQTSELDIESQVPGAR